MDHQADSWYRLDEIRNRVFRRMIKDFGAIFDGKAALVECQPRRLGGALLTPAINHNENSTWPCLLSISVPRHCILGVSSLLHYTRFAYVNYFWTPRKVLLVHRKRALLALTPLSGSWIRCHMCIRLEGYICEEGTVYQHRTGMSIGRIALKSHNKEEKIQLKSSIRAARLSLFPKLNLSQLSSKTGGKD